MQVARTFHLFFNSYYLLQSYHYVIHLLGLYSLAKRIEALGGEVGVASREDGQEGSVFWFTFPYRMDYSSDCSSNEEFIVKPIRNSSLIPSTVSSPLARRSSLATSKHILLVDDSLSILKVIGRLLELNSHTVETAANGLIGLNMLKNAYHAKKFDMVLSDVQMHVMVSYLTVILFFLSFL